MLARLHTRLISLFHNFHVMRNRWVCGLLCYRFAYRAAAGHLGAPLAMVLDLEAQQRQEQETRSGGTAGESQSSRTGSSETEHSPTGNSGTECQEPQEQEALGSQERRAPGPEERKVPGSLEWKAPGPQEPGAVMAWTKDAGTVGAGAAGTKPRLRNYIVEV